MNKVDKNAFTMYSYSERLHFSDFLRESLFHSIIDSLKLPKGSKGLDIGCGIGSNILILADAIGKSGHITGIDLSGNLLVKAKQKTDKMSLSRQISLVKGDINNLPFVGNCFDWVWSTDCVGYLPGNTANLIKNLAKAVKPGGDVFVLAWSSQQLLPGYPQLEARLNSTSAGIAPFIVGQQPKNHFMKAINWFKKSGLKEVKAETFAGNIQGPLNDEKRKAMASLFEMRWGLPESELTETEMKEYLRLCSPASADFLPNTPDYYGFFTYTLFRGKTDV